MEAPVGALVEGPCQLGAGDEADHMPGLHGDLVDHLRRRGAAS